MNQEHYCHLNSLLNQIRLFNNTKYDLATAIREEWLVGSLSYNSVKKVLEGFAK